MVLAAYSDAVLHNESKGLSRAGSHVFLAEDEPIQIWNGPILTIAQVIKLVMSSAVEDELGAIFITAKEIVPMRQNKTEMGWPKPPTHMHKEKSTAAVVANDTIVVRKTKSMDLRFHWLRCHKTSRQLCFYWAP